MIKKLIAGVALALVAFTANAQLIYNNTFPFWNVNGPLTVVGATSTSTLAVTSTSVFTGAVSLNGGGTLVGTVAGGDAATGQVGEFLTTTVATGAAVAGAASTVGKSIMTLALTAGDWDVSANCVYTTTGITATVYSCGLGTAADTQLTQAGGSGVGTDPLVTQNATFGTTLSGTFTQPIPPVRVSLAAPLTLQLVAKHTFSAGSYTMWGTIRARRVR